MKKVKVAVIGCGFLGKWHVQKVLAHHNAELVCIVEASDKGAARALEQFPEVKVVLNLDDILDQIDAALIVTPTSFHYSLSETLIKNNKHVFCEKPLTDSIKTARMLEELSLSEPNLVIQVGHSERFHPVWKTIKNNPKILELLKSDATITINRYAPFKGRATDVDVVSDLMIHDLDLLWFLLGEAPSSVQAKGHKISTDKWDHVSASLSFDSGRTAIVTSGRGHVQEARSLEVIGEKGCLLVDLMNFSYTFAAPGETGEQIVKKSYEKADHLLEEQDHFYNSILNTTESIVPIKDGVQVIHWIDCIQKSLESRSSVKI
ncbi:MAG: putative dehydrogenase [Bacteriovoracaceae bacterium]